MPKTIHKALWTLLVIISQIYDIIRWLILQLRFYCRISYDFCSKRNAMHEIEYLENCKKDLTKIPKHLSIVIGYNENITTDVLSKLAVYALILEIEYISFYDTRDQFTLEQFRIPKFVSSKPIQIGRFLWSLKGDSAKSGQLRYRNGLQKSIEIANRIRLMMVKAKSFCVNNFGNYSEYLSNQKPTASLIIDISFYSISHTIMILIKSYFLLQFAISVNDTFKECQLLVMLSKKDGKPLIAEVCKEMATKRNSDEIKSVLDDKTELTKEISASLRKKLNYLPDPELGIIFNKHMCTFGLLPWHTGFTEFYTIETGNFSTVDTFCNILYKFSKCEQRFGK